MRGIAHSTINLSFYTITFTIINTPWLSHRLPAFINKIAGNHYYLTAVSADIRFN